MFPEEEPKDQVDVSTPENLLEKRQRDYLTLKKRIVFVTILGFLFSPTLFGFVFLLNYLLPRQETYYWIRFSLFIVLEVLSLILIGYFSHIRIENPVKAKEKLKKHKKESYIQKGWFVFYHSHHLDELLEHEIKIGRRFFCSGCLGTTIGLFLGSVGALVYLPFLQQRNNIAAIVLLILGSLLVGITFLKYAIQVKGIIRLLMNSSVVIGYACMLIGSDLLFNNRFSVIYTLLFTPIIFLLRLQIVRLDHKIERLDFEIKNRII